MKSMSSEQGRWPARLLEAIFLAFPGRRMAFLQFALYVVVGGICFSIDIVGFVILRRFELPILTASAISFVTSTIANYLLCCALVFRSGRFSRGEELLRLFLIAVIGLSLNSAAVCFLA